MRKFFNDLSIRSKLILLVSGSVCALTASVLAVVWIQSLQQVRAIVQEQLETNRDLFAFAQRSHYQSHVYKGTTLASAPVVVRALERDDRIAACAALSEIQKTSHVKASGGQSRNGNRLWHSRRRGGGGQHGQTEAPRLHRHRTQREPRGAVVLGRHIRTNSGLTGRGHGT